MHSHDLISVSVGEIRPNGQGKSIINIAGGGREILPFSRRGAYRYYSRRRSRQYSLCGTPDRSNTYEICVRLTDVFPPAAHAVYQQLKAGDRLAISPPRNHFPLPAGRALPAGYPVRYRHAPLLAMAETIAARGALELHY